MITAKQRTMIMGLAGLLGAIAVIWNFAGQAIDALPYAPKSEFIQLAGDVKEIKKQNLREQMVSNRKLRWDVQERLEEYKGRGERPPQRLVDDFIELENEAQSLERELNRLEQ